LRFQTEIIATVDKKAEQSGQFRSKLPKVFGADIVFSHQTQFMENQRMLNNMDSHDSLLARIYRMIVKPL
jgi:hypothetical protein